MAYFVGVFVVMLLVQCNFAERSADGVGVGVAPAAGASPASSASSSAAKKDARCEEITIPMCKGIGYNWTSMPNSLHHGKAIEKRTLKVHSSVTPRRSKRSVY